MREALHPGRDARLVHPGLEVRPQGVEGVVVRGVQRDAVEAGAADADLGERGGGDVGQPHVAAYGAGRDAGALGDDEGAALLDGRAAVAAGVGVAVVGGDQDLPVLLGVRRAVLDGGEELADQGVDAGDGVEVLLAGRAVGVAGRVDLAEVDEGGVRVLVAQFGGGGRGDLRVLVAVAVAVAFEGEPLVDLRGEDRAVLVGGGDGLPVGGRVRVERRLGVLDAGQEVRVGGVVLAGEGVVLHAVLVGPDPGGDGGPAGARGRGGHRARVEGAAGGQPLGHQAVQVGCVGGLDAVQDRAVDADDEDLVGVGRGGAGGGGQGGGGDQGGGHGGRGDGTTSGQDRGHVLLLGASERRKERGSFDVPAFRRSDVSTFRRSGVPACAGSGPKVRSSVQTCYATVTLPVGGGQEVTGQLPVADFHAST